MAEAVLSLSHRANLDHIADDFAVGASRPASLHTVFGAHAGSNPNHPIGGDDGRGYQQRTACQTPRKQGHGHSRVHNYPPRWNGAPIRRK